VYPEQLLRSRGVPVREACAARLRVGASAGRSSKLGSNAGGACVELVVLGWPFSVPGFVAVVASARCRRR